MLEWDYSISGIRDATLYFTKYIREKRKGEVLEVHAENFGRHRRLLVKLYYRGAPVYVKVYLVFQRRWFEQFEKYFGWSEQAVTINLPILEYCVKHGINRIVWVHSSGTMFMTDPKTMLELVKKHKWIRRTRKTGEPVAHLPLSLLTRLK